MTKQEKMKSVKNVLKELESLISEHFVSDEGSDAYVLDLIQSSLDIYKELSEKVEEK